MPKPLWLQRLELDSEACESFHQWIELRKKDATREALVAATWEQTLQARAKLEAYVAIELAATAADREERERERYIGLTTARGAR